MSDIDISDRDESYRPEDVDDSESDDYSSEAEEYKSDKSMITLSDVFSDSRPDPLPPLRQDYCGVNPIYSRSLV